MIRNEKTINFFYIFYLFVYKIYRCIIIYDNFKNVFSKLIIFKNKEITILQVFKL